MDYLEPSVTEKVKELCHCVVHWRLGECCGLLMAIAVCGNIGPVNSSEDLFIGK